MMDANEWKKGLKAWEDILKQAEIDMEQARLYIPIIQKKIDELETHNEVENGE